MAVRSHIWPLWTPCYQITLAAMHVLTLMILCIVSFLETMIYNHCHLSPNSSLAILPYLTAIVSAARQV